MSGHVVVIRVDGAPPPSVSKLRYGDIRDLSDCFHGAILARWYMRLLRQLPLYTERIDLHAFSRAASAD
jgi:hypothetical protein